MRIVYLLILLAVLPGLFFLPNLLADYQNGELAGTEAQELLDRVNPLSKIEPAMGQPTVNKYLITPGRFERRFFDMGKQTKGLVHQAHYFLHAPEKPWPEAVKFPLVIHLHDKDTPAYSAEYITQPKMQMAFPAFSVVPVFEDRYKNKQVLTYNNMNQGTLPSPTEYMKNGKNSSRSLKEEKKRIQDYHDHSMDKTQSVVPFIVGMTRALVAEYPNIDETRIYITGCGYGALALFGALKQAPDLFAAGLAVNGSWSLNDTQNLEATPLMILNGSQNKFFPAVGSKLLAEHVHKAGGDVAYTQFKSLPHDCSYVKFYNSQKWDWTFSHKAKSSSRR